MMTIFFSPAHQMSRTHLVIALCCLPRHILQSNMLHCCRSALSLLEAVPQLGAHLYGKKQEMVDQ